MEKFTQNDVSDIWGKIWETSHDASVNAVFLHRLFIDGYAVMKSYIPKDASRIIEMGAGTGRYSLKIAQEFPNTQILVTDISESSLKVIMQLAGKLRLKNVQVQKEDITKQTFTDNSLDIIIMDCVIPHVPDYELAMHEVARVLKPGGLLVMAHVNPLNIPHTLHRYWTEHFRKSGYQYGLERAFSRKTWKRLCENNNLTIIATDGFAVGYGIYRHKVTHRAFALVGRIVNRLSKNIDKVTGRWCSRTFGFETVTVAVKK